MRQIVLRKISGVFDACWGNSGRPCAVSVGRAPSLLSTLGVFVLVLLPLLALIALVGGLAHFGHPNFAAAPLLGGLVVGETQTVDPTKLIKDLNHAFSEFKNSNDERMKQIEQRGYASADVVNNVEKANKAITDLSDELKKVQAALRDVENSNARLALVGTPEEKKIEARNAAQFFSLTRGTVVDQVNNDDMDAYRAYKKAFNTYLRRGNAAYSDNNVRNALSTGSATTGGLWVTPDLSGRMVELVYQTSLIRQLASVQTIGTDTLEGWNDLDEASQGWVGEQDARPETNTPLPQSKWAIPVYEQYANPKITQKMLDDSFFDVEGWLAAKVANKMARVENTAFVTGNGTNKPRGLMDYVSTMVSTKPSATNWGKIQFIKTGVNGGFPAASTSVAPTDKLLDLIMLLKIELRRGAGFFGNSTTLANIRKLKDNTGAYIFFPTFQNAVATPSAASSFGAGDPRVGGSIQSAGTIFGFPFWEIPDMDDMSNNGVALAFGDMRETYQIVDHTVGVRLLRDPFTGKPYTSYYTTKRVGGDVVNFEAMKFLQFSV